MKVLEIVDLNVSFLGETNDTQAVKSVSFTMKDGESVGVVGASGCGKSTLLHAILRSLQPPGVITSGEIWFNGYDMCKLNERDGKKKRWTEIALVVQSALSSLNPVLSIWSHFEETLDTHTNWKYDKRVDVINKSLELVQLPRHVLHSFPHQLSGGMQQRVVIALAILLEPKLIIFDEPTTALDVQVEHTLLNELKSIQNRLGFAALFVSHDLSVIKSMCQRVLVMHEGSIVDDRPTLDLDHSPVEQTRDLLNSSHLPPQEHGPTRVKEPCLELKNITHTFITPSKTVVAVKNTSLSVLKGESIGIVGESGSGKSTLGRIISGLIPPTKGQVIWHQAQPKSFAKRLFHLFKSGQPASVQMIFQNPFSALNATQTIRESMSAPLLVQNHQNKPKEQTLIEMCQRVDLRPATTILDRFPHELSGGQRQRVCIARAILGRPDILIADEPTSMLDVTLRAEILALLHRIRVEENIALILITHDLNAAQNICDRILICKDGRIVERGETTNIFNTPQHPYTQTLLNLRKQI